MTHSVQPDSHPRPQPREQTQLEPQGGVAAAVALQARPRVALAHDWLCGVRGGELVLDAVIRHLQPRCEIVGLFVMFDNGERHTPAINALPKFVSNVGSWPLASTVFRRGLLPLYPQAVEHLGDRLAAVHRQKHIDLVISTSSAAIKGLRPPPEVPHICYIHSPARYVWSVESDYARGSVIRRLGLRAFGPRFREWDRQTASNVTHFIANSSHTASEVQRCYGREASVTFPPVRTNYFTPPPTHPPEKSRRDGSWLIVSALEPYKRIDLAIAAANQRGQPLTIIGNGSQRRKLQRLAGRTVTFLGRAYDSEVREHYQRCTLLLFPQLEDFGIVACEAQACGLPVVAFGKGGAVDTVVAGATGALFDEQTVASLLSGIDRAGQLKKCDQACRQNALRFSEEAFMRSLDEVLQNYIG